MKEVIIVAGVDKHIVGGLRRRLREHGYSSMPCKSVEEIIEELKLLPTCGASVSLVVIELEILRDTINELIVQLSKCAPDVPFVSFDEGNAQTDLVEVFERICIYRTQFRPEQNPGLSNVLKETGVGIS